MQRHTFPLVQGTRARLEHAGREFLADILARETLRHPENAAALAELAHVLTRLGRLEEGLRADQALLRLVPDDPTVHYNLACSLALLERPDQALDALERAIDLGYDDPEHLLADEDLAGLRAERRFRELLRRLGGEQADLNSR
jgi:tetratricopeptide (TPR) repeat protein